MKPNQNRSFCGQEKNAISVSTRASLYWIWRQHSEELMGKLLTKLLKMHLRKQKILRKVLPDAIKGPFDFVLFIFTAVCNSILAHIFPNIVPKPYI